MRWGLIVVVAAAAALTAVEATADPPAVAVAPAPERTKRFSRRRKAHRGQYPFLALVANMWGECTAVILAPMAVLGPSSCLPEGYLQNGRVDAGNSLFSSMEDFGETPSQGKIIDEFIKLKPRKPGDDTIMIMKLLEPFYFTPYVQPIPIATVPRSSKVRALVVGYGMGSAEWERRQQTVIEVELGGCRPRRSDAMCVDKTTADCRPDHGAAVVVRSQLLAVAGKESLCSGQVLLLAPHRAWITEQLREIVGYGDDPFVPHGRHQGQEGVKPRAPAVSLRCAVCARWPLAALLSLLARALY